MMILTMVALIAASAADAGVAEPCGGPIQVVDGVVKTKLVLTGAPKEDACLKAIVPVLAVDPNIRSVTVEMRTPDDQRVGGKALKTATRVVDVLVAAGLTKEALSAVVPRADGEEQGLKLIVRYRPPALPTVQVTELSGEALGGRDESHLEAKRAGAGLSAQDVYVTRRGGAVLSLPEVGSVRLGANTAVKVLPPTEKGVPVLALLRGDLFAETLPGGNGFELVLDDKWRLTLSPASRADVTFSSAPYGWSVAVYDGRVLPGGHTPTETPVTPWIEAGHGSSASGELKLADLPHPLLPAPVVKSTFGKPLSGELHWEAVKDATQYRVEIARDAAFGASTVAQVAAGTSVVVDPAIGSGKFFFRVLALDGGLPGAPSKVYSFTR
jgi:hypothetical protein